MSDSDEKRAPQRNRPGTKNADLNYWPDQSIQDMDGTFAVQQYIQQQIRKDRANLESLISPPEGQDEALWQYEHLRQFTLELNHLTVMFDDICTSETCPKMKATDEWLYLCAAHKTPQEVF